MNYLLDTNIIIIYSRKSDIATKIEEQYRLFDDSNNLAISVVTLGELDAIIKKLNLGDRRKECINNILARVSIAKVSINHSELAETGTLCSKTKPPKHTKALRAKHEELS